jgi:hypothetical protein
LIGKLLERNWRSFLPDRYKPEFVGYLAHIPLTNKDFFLHRPQLFCPFHGFKELLK